MNTERKTKTRKPVFPDGYDPTNPMRSASMVPRLIVYDDSKERKEVEERFARLRENMKYSHLKSV